MRSGKINIGKVLGYPALALIVLLVIATVYLGMSDKETAFSNLTVENVTMRPPAPGQTTAAAYFDIINKGGANELLSASTPISDKVELHTHLHEDGMMKMRMVKSVKIMPKETTEFKRGGLHVMIFNVDIPENMKQIPITLTFARPPVQVPVQRDESGKRIDVPKDYTVTVLATVEE